MPTYDFLNLSPIEFQDLVRDLLQQREKMIFECYKGERDMGIDFQSTPNGIIGQAKRYQNDFKRLYRDLSNLELDKVKILNPQRYIFATSVSLTPKNKSQIKKLFNPFIKSTGDILGRDDLNNLIGVFPQIEENHFKLWIASTNVIKGLIQKIIEEKIYRKELNYSHIELERINEQAKFYVQTKSFIDALKIIKRDRYVIISGLPGIGKTTLGRALVSYFLARDGYDEFINIVEDASSGVAMFKPGVKQVFFFDDFMGNIEFCKPATDDNPLIKFIEIVRKSRDKVLIITTREYVLSKGLLKYPNLKKLNLSKCILKREEYSELIKAKILYNHLFFLDVNEKCINSLVQFKEYEGIINHSNYSPRLIEIFLLDREKQKKSGYNFVSSFKKFLSAPYDYTNDIFLKLSDAAQLTLLILLTTDDPIFYYHLLSTFRSTIRYRKVCELGFEVDTFEKSLKELHDTFIIIYKDLESEERVIEFHNNWIKDFLRTYLGERDDLIEILVKGSMFFNQFFHIFEPCEFHNNSIKKAKLTDKKILLKDYLKVVLENKLLTEFDQIRFSTLEKSEWQNGSEYELCDESVNSIWKLTMICQAFDIDRNKKIRDFVIERFIKIRFHGEEGQKLLSEDEMVGLPKLMKLIKKYINIDVERFIQEYYDAITWTSEFLEFSYFRELYPDKFLKFVTGRKREISKKIKETILDDIEYFFYECNSKKDEKLDNLLAFFIDEVFEAFGIKKSKHFMNEVYITAGRQIPVKKAIDNFTANDDITEISEQYVESVDIESIFNLLLPRKNFQNIRQDEKTIFNLIQNEIGNKDLAKLITRRIYKSNNTYLYRIFLTTPLHISELLRYLRYNNMEDENFHAFHRNFFSSMLDKEKAEKPKIELTNEELFCVMKKLAFRTYIDNYENFRESYVTDIFNQIKDQEEIKFESEPFLEYLENWVCIFYRNNDWLSFLTDSFQYYFAALYFIQAPNALKKYIYHEDLRNACDDDLYSDRDEKIWQLLFEWDRKNFLEYFVLPILKEIVEKMESKSERGLCKRYFSFFQIELQWLSKDEYMSGTSPAFVSDSVLFDKLLKFLEIPFGTESIDIFFLELGHKEVFEEMGIPSETHDKLVEYFKLKIKKTDSASRYLTVSVCECIKDESFYSIISELGICRDISNGYGALKTKVNEFVHRNLS